MDNLHELPLSKEQAASLADLASNSLLGVWVSTANVGPTNPPFQTIAVKGSSTDQDDNTHLITPDGKTTTLG